MQYETVLTREQLEHWLGRIGAAELTSVDTETTSLDPLAARLVGLSLSVEPFKACYIPLAHRYAGAPDQLPFQETLDALKPWLESPHHRKVGQHLKYDMHVFANHGVRLAGIAHDTLLQSYVLEAHRSHDMDSLAERHLQRRTLTYVEVCGKGANQLRFDEVALDRATEYAAEDAEVTFELHRALWPRIEAEPALRHIYEDIELPTAQVLYEMERCGVLIDRERLGAQSRELGARIAELEIRAQEAAGQPFNLGSPKQIGEILFGKLGLPVVKKTASGAPSTDEEVLEKLAEDFPLPKMLLEHRGLSKLKSTYCDKLPAMADAQRPRAHALRAGDRRHRAPVVERSQPAEHPDPHGRGPPHPRGLHRAARASDRVGGLLADRVAHHGPHLGRRRPARRVRQGRGHPSRDGVGSVRRAARRGQRASSAATRRSSTSA